MTMKKLLGLSFLIGMVFAMSSTSQAASARGGAKPATMVGFTTNAALVGVSSTAVTLYQVNLSTMTAGDYIALFDSNSIVGLSGPGTTQLKTRLYGVATVNTVYTFDPPVIFKNGLIASHSAGLNQALITYEKGINLQNQ
jgi:hypothetical protein